MNSRYEELDSLRGLAALSVFFGHMYLIFNESLISKILFKLGPFRFFIAGGEAVTLFFVLSGFVLSLPYIAKKEISYFSYVIKRICRIYIPYIAVFLIAIVSRGFFYTGKISFLSGWFNESWSSIPSFQTVKEHLILINTFSSNLNNVVWSLVHEMRISFVFPFIMVIILKTSLKKAIGMGIGLSLISIIYFSYFHPSFYGTEIYVTVHFCAMFIIGALLAKNIEYIKKRITMMKLRYKKLLFLAGIILYLYFHPSFLFNMVINGFNPYYRTVIDSWFTTIGAAILIVLAISTNFISKILRNKVINHIGKISYSLYLSHLTVLLSCVHFLNKQMPIWSILLIVILLTFVLSNILYYLVEKPTIKLGKYLTRLISRSLKNKSRNENTVRIS